jgi:copper chaperone CopZ
MASTETVTSAQIESSLLQTPEPVALDFYQASCAPCRVLEPRLERVAEQYVGQLPVYRVDIDRDMPVAERFGVMSLPIMLILHPGKEAACLAFGRQDLDLPGCWKVYHGETEARVDRRHPSIEEKKGDDHDDTDNDFTVTGEQQIHCAGCEQRIGNALRRLPGIQDVKASAGTQQVAVTTDPAAVSSDQVRAKLEQLGYQVKSMGDSA